MLRQNLSFAPEAFHTLGVPGKLSRQDLDGDIPIELGIGSTVNDAHATFAKLSGDFVVRNLCSDHVPVPRQVVELSIQ